MGINPPLRTKEAISRCSRILRSGRLPKHAEAMRIASCLDAMALAFELSDDAQVASLIVQKRYGPIAGLTVNVSPLDS